MSTIDRAPFTAARTAGKAVGQRRRLAAKNQCHYCNDQSDRCTAEILDPLAEVKLCAKHTADVLEYAIRIQQRINMGATS